MPRRNQPLVPQAYAALELLKYEVAQELGITLSPDGYNGYIKTRDAGAIGGNMVRRMIRMVEQQLSTRV
ncbi:spore protein [Cohnella kolymensis]|uniref:Spore protein n=1 Tax=Cohnella kolymensis TaxID=1590652 RepID=A0ABR5A363_9BACL|nr:alpha/beta-type small acid-soluble spore protein [Cohnella kolymensis]KIL35436.1 spore protein [Cohnella kolymensis]